MTELKNRKSRYEKLLRRSVLVPVVAASLLAVLLLWQIQSLLNTNRSVAHSDEVLSQIQSIQKSMLDAETGIRGFAITHRAEYLEPYHHALSEIPSRFIGLNRLVADNSSQLQVLEGLRESVDQWLVLSKRALQKREHSVSAREHSVPAREHSLSARNRVSTREQSLGAGLDGRGKALMDRIREEIDWFVQREMILRNMRSQKAERAARLCVSMGIATALILGLFFSFFARGSLVSLSRHYESTLDAWQESREWFATTLRSIGDAVMVIDLDSKIAFLNTVAEELTGWRHDEALGRPMNEIFRIINEETREPAFNPVERVLREGLVVGLANHTVLIRRDGREFPIEDSAAPIRIGSEKARGVVLVFRDVSAKYRSEKILRQNTERLDLAQEAAQVGTFEWNIVENKNIWSAEIEKLYGLTPGTFDGTLEAWTQRVHPDDLAETLKKMHEVIKLGQSFRAEFRIILPSGVQRWMQSRAKILRDATGRPLKMIGVNIDITERKNAESAALESEARFQSVADAAPVLIWISGVDKLDYWFNQTWLDFTGRTLQQECGQGRIEGVHPDDVDDYVKNYNAKVDQRQAFEMEYRLRRHDGIYRWVIDKALPRFAPDRRFLGYIGTCVDIDEMKQAQEVLKKSEYQLRSITETIPQLIWRTRLDGSADYFSQKFVEYLGYPMEQILGWGWSELIHPDDYPQIMEIWRQARAELKAVSADFRVRRASGVYRWFLSMGAPFRDDSGQVLSYYGTWTDIEDQKQAQAKIEKALQSRDDFLSVASHELKTPLTALKLQLQILLRKLNSSTGEGLEPERLKRVLTLCNHQSTRLNNLVDDLLDVTRIQQGRLAFHFSRVNLSEIVKNQLAQLADQFAEAKSMLSFGGGEDVWTICDAFRMEQVIINLLTNALKYGAGKPVWVHVQSQNGLAEIIVQDEGIGIAADKISVIFDRFERAIGARNVSGLGLGLYIARQIVEAHRGTIQVESELAQGTRFSVSIPLEQKIS